MSNPEIYKALDPILDRDGEYLKMKGGQLDASTAPEIVVEGGGLLKSEAPIWHYSGATEFDPLPESVGSDQVVMWAARAYDVEIPAATGRPWREPYDFVMRLVDTGGS